MVMEEENPARGKIHQEGVLCKNTVAQLPSTSMELAQESFGWIVSPCLLSREEDHVDVLGTRMFWSDLVVSVYAIICWRYKPSHRFSGLRSFLFRAQIHLCFNNPRAALIRIMASGGE